MNCARWVCLTGLLVAGTGAFAQDAAPTNKVKKAAPISSLSGDALTEDQIASLKTQWVDEKSKTKIQFASSFGMSQVSPADKKRYARSGKVPIRVTAELVELKEVGGRTLAKRIGGSVHLYVQDADGKIVAKKSIPAEKMCPS